MCICISWVISSKDNAWIDLGYFPLNDLYAFPVSLRPFRHESRAQRAVVQLLANSQDNRNRAGGHSFPH